MIRRLHRFLVPVDRYQAVSGVGATGVLPIGQRLDTSEKGNLCNLRNLRIINFLHRRLDQYWEVRP